MNPSNVPDFKHNIKLKLPQFSQEPLMTQPESMLSQDTIDHLNDELNNIGLHDYFCNNEDCSDTLDYFEAHVKQRSKPGENILATLTPEKCHLWHMGTGVVTEAGELLDAIKKCVCYDQDLNAYNVVEELGDLLFYIQGTILYLQRLGVTLDLFTILQHNILKLERRYPTTYSDDAAKARADKSPTSPSHSLDTGEDQGHSFVDLTGVDVNQDYSQQPCTDPTTEND